MPKIIKWTTRLIILFFTCSSFAGEVDVIKVEIQKNDDQTYRFHVTLRHDDTGWDHFANAWEVVSLKGKVIAKRVLHHPHVDEQPFTRSLTSVELPAGTEYVIVRGHDSVHKYGGIEKKVKIPN